MNTGFHSKRALAKLAAALTLVQLLSACSETTTQNLLQSDDQGNGGWELQPPEMLQHRALSQAVTPRVTLNEEVLDMTIQADGFIYQGTTQVTEGEDIDLRVEWIELYRGRELLLAVAEKTFPEVSRDIAITLLEDDYNQCANNQEFAVDCLIARYPEIDADNDKIPNLTERLENSDPYSPLDPGTTRADVFITGIDPAQAPVIDGSYDITWNLAQFQDRDDDDLYIDNRIIGFDPTRSEGNTEFRWGAMHDSRYLYLFILGERAENRTSQGDSILPWHDDAVDIFWDGNRSQGATYDGVDDYHLIIPLMKLGLGTRNRSRLLDGSPDPDARAETGANSQLITALDGVEFANCICPDQDTYEIRLDLEKLQIPIGESFGFDIQINNDIDGDDREFKFGWRAPSAPNTVFSNDLTWSDPSRMGLAELVPNPPPTN